MLSFRLYFILFFYIYILSLHLLFFLSISTHSRSVTSFLVALLERSLDMEAHYWLHLVLGVPVPSVWLQMVPMPASVKTAGTSKTWTSTCGFSNALCLYGSSSTKLC